MKVSDFMSKPVISIDQNETVEKAATLMCEKGISAMPVTDSSQALVGIITESDFVGQDAKIPHSLGSIKQLFGRIHNFGDIEEIYHSTKSKKISEVMKKNVKTIEASSSLNQLLSLMSQYDLKRVPVVEGDKCVGMVTRKNLISAFLKS